MPDRGRGREAASVQAQGLARGEGWLQAQVLELFLEKGLGLARAAVWAPEKIQAEILEEVLDSVPELRSVREMEWDSALVQVVAHFPHSPLHLLMRRLRLRRTRQEAHRVASW